MKDLPFFFFFSLQYPLIWGGVLVKHVIFALSRRTGPDVGKCESLISTVVEIVNYHIPVKFCPVFARVEVLQRVHIDSP